MFLVEPFRYFHHYFCRSFIQFRCQSSLHQSPIGIKIIGETLSMTLSAHLADQKIFGSMPCPNVFTSLMVVSQPCDSSRHGQ